MRDVNRFASALLWPFWLVGRFIAAFSVAADWIWEAFTDGLGQDEDDGFDVGALTVIWLVGLTVWVIFW